MRTDPVIIVGGGLSGLSAAVTLSSRGIPVTLFEQKPSLGGRAYSFTDATTGETIDNGQHVLIGGYERTMKFLDAVGTRELLKIQPRPELLFHDPQRGFQRLSLPNLPPPLHLIFGILRCDLFSWMDRWRILRAGRMLQGVDERKVKNLTIDQWLDSAGQTVEAKRSFWEPLAVSIMNEHITTAAALVFARSLQKAFLGGRMNASLAIPTVGLSDLYVHPAQKFISSHGGTIACGADVVEILYDGSHVTGVRLKGNDVVNCSGMILAVQHSRMTQLLPEILSRQPKFSAIETIPTSPIVSVHLWFDSDNMADDFVGLIGRRVQWLFNKRKIQNTGGKGGHVSAVISAADEFVGLTNDELIRLTMEDLRSVYPSFPDRPAHAVVIREKRATFSCTPATEKLRPSQRTPIQNLFLAGDWTDTGHPATIEGAIVSGERCADLVGELLIRK